MEARRSLEGISIVNTRASHQAAPLTTRLTKAGASVLEYPAIRIVPPADTGPLDMALHALADGDFDWLILTSTNAVESLAQRLQTRGLLEQLALGRPRVAAVGPATAQAVHHWLGLEADVIPDEFVAESLAGTIDLQPGARVFLPQSEIARAYLAEALRSAGAEVTQTVAYRTLLGQGGDPVPQLFWEGRIDAVTFTSPSSVHNFLKRLKAEGGNPGMLVDVIVACIGPQTADAARGHELPVQAVPKEHTIEGLVEALAQHFGEKSARSTGQPG
ncbi:MAG: uroporphyrinogen-III synthase [Caldilineaceae bacterium]|nr:uroporphyrinogen-III synthase [Caldilineaceae bacterium]